MRSASVVLCCLALGLAVWALPAPAAVGGELQTYGIPALQAIQDAYHNGEIDRAEALLYRGYFIKQSERLPERFRIEGGHLKCGTSILMEACEELAAMGRGDAVADLRARPTNLPLTRTTANFTIHYTTSGSDAVSEAYVDVIQDACEVSYAAFHTTYGYAPPPGDGELGGGTDLTDVYVHALGGNTMGMTEPETSVPGYPPYYDFTGFFHVNTNISGVGDRKVTVAHEYMHVVQFGYNANNINDWWLENCAMMGEEYAYDSVNGYRGYLPQWMGWIHESLYTHDESFEYGQISWPMYQSERFSPDLVLDIWTRLAMSYTFFDDPVIEPALAVYGYTLLQANNEFKIWSVYTNFRNDGNHFQEAGAWSTYLYPDKTLSAYPTGEQHPSATKRPQALGSSFMAFQPEAGSTDNTLVVTFDGPICTYSVTLFLKQSGVAGYVEYYMPIDAAGNGTISLPDWDTADWAFMLINMNDACTGWRDFIFSADTEMGTQSIAEGEGAGLRARLYPNYPNPVSDRTALSYSLPRQSAVDARIVDATGRLVRTLFTGDQNAGTYEIMWNRQDDGGREVASGAYYAIVRVDGQELTRQLTVLK
jgi:hypothetical protein